MVFQSLVHVSFNRVAMCRYILEYLLFDEPSKEVELSHRRNKGLDSAGLKHDALPAAERIKETLTVGVELSLVMKINEKMLSGRHEGGVHLLRIVCHKIVYETQTDRGRTVDNGKQFFEITGLHIKLL